jgi:broad specificity phosphatase PhoE
MLGLLVARLLGGGIEMYRSFKFDNCGVTELTRLGDGRWRLARYNDVSHLGGA